MPTLPHGPPNPARAPRSERQAPRTYADYVRDLESRHPGIVAHLQGGRICQIRDELLRRAEVANVPLRIVAGCRLRPGRALAVRSKRAAAG